MTSCPRSDPLRGSSRGIGLSLSTATASRSSCSRPRSMHGGQRRRPAVGQLRGSALTMSNSDEWRSALEVWDHLPVTSQGSAYMRFREPSTAAKAACSGAQRLRHELRWADGRSFIGGELRVTRDANSPLRHAESVATKRKECANDQGMPELVLNKPDVRGGPLGEGMAAESDAQLLGTCRRRPP
jgi:hypothetical protein